MKKDKKENKMKKTKLLLAPLLIVMGLNAKPTETTEVKSTSMEESNVKTGTTIGHYQKPGAPIDMTYKSITVNANETSDINITLTTTVQTGTMSVTITVDDELKQEESIEKEITFEISPEQKAYPINLQVSSEKDGLYYIRLLTKIDKAQSSKLRAFAVPVYVGANPQPKSKGLNIMKATSGENLSVSKAVETIEVIKE